MDKEDQALQIYFNQIKDIKLLSFEEELELSRRIQKGDQDAKQQLVESNLKLVVKIAKEYMNNDFGFLDIIQEGNLGLMKAASKYDYRKNVRFSTYAAWWIKQSIVRALSKKRRSIRLPHRKEDLLKKCRNSYFSLTRILGRQPSLEEIAAEVGAKTPDVADVMNLSGGVMSLDMDLNDEETNTLMDLYEDNTYSPDEDLYARNIRQTTLYFLEQLLEKEKQILLYRFAFYGGKKYTLKRIGEEMGVSPETIRQIELRALRKLKERSEEIREYIYS